MEKKLSDIHKERGISKKCLLNIARSKDSPAHKVSAARNSWWYFDEEKLDKWLAKHAGVAFVLAILLLLIPSAKAQAAVVKGETALGGMSYYINAYIDKHGSIVDEDDWQLLASAMELENGCNNDKCLLYTGSVILNRVADKNFPNTIEDVILDGYGDRPGPQQYATKTIRELYTTIPSERSRMFALHLLLCGSKLPRGVIYQSMFLQGSGTYCDPSEVNGEYFCWK